jgi:hypothetical protein
MAPARGCVTPPGTKDDIMRRIIEQLTDDLTDAPADETVRFALDGTSYLIDLTADNAKTMREAFAAYVEVARRDSAPATGGRAAARGGGRRVTAAAQRAARSAYLQSVRAWARDHGYTMSEFGRVPESVLAAYGEATGVHSPDDLTDV